METFETKFNLKLSFHQVILYSIGKYAFWYEKSEELTYCFILPLILNLN